MNEWSAAKKSRGHVILVLLPVRDAESATRGTVACGYDSTSNMASICVEGVLCKRYCDPGSDRQHHVASAVVPTCSLLISLKKRKNT
jgi:hypothetical protein